MSSIKALIANLILTLKSFLPTRIPVGMTGYNAWLADIKALTGPIADEMSLDWVISTEVLRLPPGRDRVPKRLLVKLVRKGAANQVASFKIQEIKQAQEERIKAQQAQAETAPKDAACLPNTSV